MKLSLSAVALVCALSGGLPSGYGAVLADREKAATTPTGVPTSVGIHPPVPPTTIRPSTTSSTTTSPTTLRSISTASTPTPSVDSGTMTWTPPGPDTSNGMTSAPPPPRETCILPGGTTVIVIGGGPCPSHVPGGPFTSITSSVSVIPVIPTTYPPGTTTADCFLPNGQTIKGPCPTITIPTSVAPPVTTADCFLPNGQTIEGPCPTTTISSHPAPPPVTTADCFLPNGQTIEGPCPTTTTFPLPPSTSIRSLPKQFSAFAVGYQSSCGTGFIGGTICVDGTYCKFWNAWFSQCLPNGTT
ncbi:hypothetical protein BDW22DRAFT_1342646 [Trametopsis cervina]|nr:hypothetical protein BDW22DRAFT_1342646 [Trametopsis cervina]